MEPEPTPTSFLSNLNEDCLGEIFGYVPAVDLCSITETCVRLNDVGRKYFCRKYKRFICKYVPYKMDQNEEDDLIRLLKTFGSLMVELTIDLYCYCNESYVADAIFKYCTNLEALTLLTYDVPDDRHKITAMASVFRKLKRLSLDSVNISVINETGGRFTMAGNLLNMFDGCDLIRDLKVDNCQELTQNLFLSSTFPSLENFMCASSDSPHIGDFVLRHKNLKSFSLRHTRHDAGSVLKAVGECKQLESLRYDLHNSNIHKLSDSAYRDLVVQSIGYLETLQNLKDFRIYNCELYATKFIEIFPKISSSLQILDLKKFDLDVMSIAPQLENLRSLRLRDSHKLLDIHLITKSMKHLTELHLCDLKVRPFDLIKIIKGLENLTKLMIIIEGYVISKQTYNRLVDVVANRSQPKNRVLYLFWYMTSTDIEESAAVQIIYKMSFSTCFF